MNSDSHCGINASSRKGLGAFTPPGLQMADKDFAGGTAPAFQAADSKGLSALFELIRQRPIVVPVAFTEECLAAIKLAIDLAADEVERVHLIHVVTEREPHEDKYISDWSDDGCRIERARRRLENACESAGLDICSKSLDIAYGQTAECVVDHASKCDAGLILIPSHAKHGLLSLLKRSIAEQIVERATCPVLVLKGANA